MRATENTTRFLLLFLQEMNFLHEHSSYPRLVSSARARAKLHALSSRGDTAAAERVRERFKRRAVCEFVAGRVTDGESGPPGPCVTVPPSLLERANVSDDTTSSDDSSSDSDTSDDINSADSDDSSDSDD